MMSLRDRFNAPGKKNAAPPRDGHPSPQALFGKRIKTREVLDWLDRRKPDNPALELTPDDATSREHARYENARLARMARRRFHKRAEKGRDDFKTAHDFGLNRKNRTPER
ncbi:MAG: hypothetical protein AAF718_03555 [Pseudomonadota bacterium]